MARGDGREDDGEMAIKVFILQSWPIKHLAC